MGVLELTVIQRKEKGWNSLSQLKFRMQRFQISTQLHVPHYFCSKIYLYEMHKKKKKNNSHICFNNVQDSPFNHRITYTLLHFQCPSKLKKSEKSTFDHSTNRSHDANELVTTFVSWNKEVSNDSLIQTISFAASFSITGKDLQPPFCLEQIWITCGAFSFF